MFFYHIDVSCEADVLSSGITYRLSVRATSVDKAFRSCNREIKVQFHEYTKCRLLQAVCITNQRQTISSYIFLKIKVTTVIVVFVYVDIYPM